MTTPWIPYNQPQGPSYFSSSHYEQYGGVRIGNHATIPGQVAGRDINTITNNFNSIFIAQPCAPPPYPDPPAKPRLFISHYAESPETQAALHDLEAKLKDHFDVLVDTQRLKDVGWQPLMYTWMDVAHAAVILISPEALDRPELATEVSILTARQMMDPHFRLLPLLAGVTSDQLAGHPRFAGVNWHEFAIPPTDDHRGAVDQLIQHINTHGFGESPVEKLIHELYPLIGCLTKQALTNAAVELQIKLDDVVPPTVPHIALMRHMWHADQGCLAKAIKELARELSGPALQTLIDAVAASWVDPRTARWVPVAARRARKQRAVQLKANLPFFACTMLVRRAYCQSPRFSRNIISTNPVTDGSAKAVIAEVRSVIKKTLYYEESVDDPQLNRWLAARDEPLFVIVPVYYLDTTFVNQLLEELGDVTFFFVLLRHSPQLGTGPTPLAELLALDPDPGYDTVEDAAAKFRALFTEVGITRLPWADPKQVGSAAPATASRT
jgi:hypothetical protein